MAAGMIYTIGGSFWEFGGPDLERAKLFVMIGTAEDHHSNPLKIAISKFKRDGGRFISINPVRTGYSAIADEWVPIRPGTDGALLLALIHELIALGLYDRDFLVRYTNAGQLVNLDEAHDEFGMFVRTEVPRRGSAATIRRTSCGGTARPTAPSSRTPRAPIRSCSASSRWPTARAVKPAFQLLQERVKDYTPEWAAGITGIPAETIRRLAHEMGITARDQKIELPIAWTDSWGQRARHRHRQSGRLPRDARAGRAFERLPDDPRAGDPDDAARHDRPSRRLPPQGAVSAPDPALRQDAQHAARGPAEPPARRPGARLAGATRTICSSTTTATPVRIDKAFSWEYPLSVHGMMHNVITNAWRGDPYPIDTLLIFMANMAWNSTMNTVEVRQMLNDKGEDGEYKIPFLVVCDAFQSEMTAFADLILPDTTYLERHDVMSMLDRPISEFDGPVDSVRIPVVPPTGRVQAVPGSADRARGAPRSCRRSCGRTARASSATIPISSSTTRPSPDPASASSPAGAARAARSSCAASPIRSSGRCTRRTTASTTTSCRRPTSTCATGTRATSNGRSACASRATPSRS